MEIYIVRHGQTTSNALQFHSLEEDELTDLGIKQAEKLRDEIKDMDFDIVISSPLIRTKQTTKIINIKNKEVIFDDRIKERSPGNLGGKSRENEDREEYWNYYGTIRYGTEENIKTFFERVYSFLDELKTQDYKKVLIVAHSGVSKAFNGYFEGIQDGKFLNRGLKNCQIKQYEIN